MNEEESLVLLAKWQTGSDQAAAAELYARYSGRLMALAQKRLSSKLARRVDPEEIVNSVARTFFLRVRDGRLVVPVGADLWHLLSVIAVKKVLGQVEYQSREKRSMNAEVAYEDSVVVGPHEAWTREPAPEVVLGLEEERDRILARYLPHHAEAVRLKLRGEETGTIAETLGVSDSMVSAILRRFAQDLQTRLAGEGES
jgi:RNA polymerase sigma-70 factor, ECF subfamily